MSGVRAQNSLSQVQSWGEKKKAGKKEKKEKQLESKKVKAVHVKVFKQPLHPIPEGQHVTGLVHAV